ncbi:hypothetical protein DWF00_28335 [Bosea caraganae]|uniref:Uncharacterized protein n=1 Tax=Bosea caraganae TaxID=2763117 RepID=A0A370L2W8_9HYPH|nr:hypothetical protein [Bosea caraganae]RDJ20854.1 hypothetical protein DWF00_28335 [Bosea caraganae]RDJ22613.1 hypothetical protein DWE98_19490 [Bosea caraganae]
MTITVTDHEIRLTGRCGVDEAEALLAALSESPQNRVVLAAERIHTALWQVLVALRPSVLGEAPDRFSAEYILPLIARKDEPVVKT